MIDGIREIANLLEEQRYIADRSLATTLYLAARSHRPVLVEGHAGVGKTECAKVLALALKTRLIRLQCYEGLDASTALYEWNYPKQILRLTIESDSRLTGDEKEQLIFSEAFLLKRPLLEAITEAERAPVVLVDEIDRADEEFEAFLLEVLSEFQVTIPEMGTVVARHKPYVVLTSNRTRELSDALKRRCLYLWIDYPDWSKELRIVGARLPDLSQRLAEQIVTFVQLLRRLPLAKLPGTAETLDWAVGLIELHADRLDPEVVGDSLSCLLKDRDDVEFLSSQRVGAILAELAALEAGQAPDRAALDEAAARVAGKR